MRLQGKKWSRSFVGKYLKTKNQVIGVIWLEIPIVTLGWPIRDSNQTELEVSGLVTNKDIKGNLRYTDDQLRQVRRYLKKGYRICQSVSKGQFPGRNNL